MRTIDFGSARIKSGTKVRNESEPILTLTSGYNGFKLNGLAMSTLGVKQGDKVVLFSDFDPNDPVEQEERYYIAKEVDEALEGATIGVNNLFSYSGIWGTMLANDKTLQSVTPDVLVEKGLMTINDKNTKIATKTCDMILVPYQDGKEIDVDGVMVKLFQLTNFRFKDHTPRTINKTGAEVEDNLIEDAE